jgi:four helix bundle protein
VASYEDLRVYQSSFAALRPVHDLVRTFPPHERCDLGSQMRRASKSIPALIAEGYARNRSPRELCSFLAQAIGSANEMEVHLKTARELGYAAPEACNRLIDEYEVIGKQLTRLMQYWRGKSGS